MVRFRYAKFYLLGIAICSLVAIYVFGDALNAILVGHECHGSYDIKIIGDPVIILLWTPYFGQNLYPSERNGHIRCSSDCILSSSRCFRESANAIVFHWRDTNVLDLPEKLDRQKWVVYNEESPENIPLLSSLNMKLVEDKIDWVLSYRLDSDVVSPYGRFVERTTNTNYSSTNLKRVLKNKTKPIAWLVSNCATPSQREDFVDELKRYIEVDVYGACGSKECSLTNRHDCYKSLEQDYYFYLSFENSLCKDYATEKIFKIMNYDIVPITFGSAQYAKILPNKSYVDALNFSSPLELSIFLKSIIANKDEYKSYFKWKEQLRVDTDFNGICLLCNKLIEQRNSLTNKLDSGKDNERAAKYRTNKRKVSDWWYNANCTSWNRIVEK